MSDGEPLHGKPPLDTDLAWLDLMQTARKNALTTLNDVAKQLIAITPILSGLYASALSFAKIKVTYWQAHDEMRYVFMAPILFWLICLCGAVAAIFPQPYKYNPLSPDDSKTAYERLTDTKYLWLRVSMIFLIISIVALLWAIWTYLNLMATGNIEPR